MRLHHLEVTAFGPYADTQVVDFDSLNQAGVFLLTGPTGSGKTSILDAVCYALYSVVPGDREVRGLRSDHAPPDRAPRVELELTLGGRRLRVVRSPEWRRPKRRGSGTTKEQASARLFEIEPDGTERLISDRAQEVGHELSMLLGMTSEQFMQVVLLPQSGFQTFLKAKSDERRDVLEKLFATQRFSRIEDWMHDRARTVRDHAQESLAGVRTLLAVLRDRSGGTLPEGLSEPLCPDDAPRLAAWATELVASAESRVAVLASEVGRTAEHAARAETHAEQARRRHLLVQRRDRARADLAALADTEHEHVERLTALDADRRAHGVATLVPALDRARTRSLAADEQASRAGRALADALARLRPAGPDEPAGADETAGSAAVGDPAELLERLAAEEQHLRALRSRADDLLRHTDEVATTEAALTAAEAAVQGLDADRVALPERRSALERELATATARAARLADALSRHDEATERVAAARAHAVLLPRLATAEAHERAAHSAANDARSRALDLVAQRLEGIAAELAGRLVEGEACQVCGSTDHPAPAASTDGAVTEVEQVAAQDAADAARIAHDEARRAADELRARVAETSIRAGGLDVTAAGAALREADAAVHDARTAEVARRACAERLGELAVRLEQLAAAHETASVEAADLRARLDASRAARAAAVADLQAALGGEDTDALADRLESRLAGVITLSALARELAETRATSASAAEALAEAEAEIVSAACHAGFEDLASARAALLDADVRRAWERACRDRDDAHARATGVLAEPEVAALPDDDQDEPPGTLFGTAGDLSVAEEAARTTRQAHARAEALHEHAEQQLTALRAQSDQLRSALAEWAPAETEAATVSELANLVRGSGGNRLRMRLSSYVLATRLDQVLDAANARLSHMRDTRYLLRRTDRARRANAQAGLDLEVLDEWTGEVRPPSSLSGGECFVVSLALALGLADVIGEESGGVEVDTLFIDEGFGSLDPETLDQVMDRIDELRSGGRSVGVVSHVSELRSRITTQVHVRPTRAGSHIAIAHTDA